MNAYPVFAAFMPDPVLILRLSPSWQILFWLLVVTPRQFDLAATVTGI